MRTTFIIAGLLASASLAADALTHDFTLTQEFGPKRQSMRFTFEFVPRDWTEGVALDRIVVSGLSRKQTLRVDFSASESEPARYRTSTSVTDLNGDGFGDLLVPTFSASGNNGFFVWIYLPDSDEFVFCPELSAESNPEPSGTGVVKTYSRDGGPNRTTNTYRWTGKRFELVGVYRWHQLEGAVYETSKLKQDGKWIEEYSRPVQAQ